MKISAGNLTYHFKTKAALLDAIYEQMMADSIDYLHLDSFMNLNDFRKVIIKFHALQKTYSFFFHDMVFIIRKYPELGEKFKVKSQERLGQGRQMIDFLIQSGRLLPESEHINYEYFIQTVWVVNTFWVAQEQVKGNSSTQGNTMSALEMVWGLLWLYLTPKGQEEYQEINAFIAQNQ